MWVEDAVVVSSREDASNDMTRLFPDGVIIEGSILYEYGSSVYRGGTEAPVDVLLGGSVVGVFGGSLDGVLGWVIGVLLGVSNIENLSTRARSTTSIRLYRMLRLLCVECICVDNPLYNCTNPCIYTYVIYIFYIKTYVYKI